MGIPALKPEEVEVIALHSSKTGDRHLTANDIDRMQRESGRISIGYHYVIRRCGLVEEGRPLAVRGNHLADRNHCSIGVCLIGGKPTRKQWEATETLIEELQTIYPETIVEDYLLD